MIRRRPLDSRKHGRSVTRWLTRLAGGILVLAMGLLGPTRAEIFSTEQFKIDGDFRFRLESDFASRDTAGVERDDRTRARVRLRVGFDYTPIEPLTFGARLRSGSDLSQQSPHMTVIDANDNDTGSLDFNIDKWYLKARKGRFSGWAGREALPIWKQNELIWDDDATVAGLAGSYDTPVGPSGKLAVKAAWVTLPAGMRRFVGEMVVGQVVYSHAFQRVDLTLAGGVLDSRAADSLDQDPDAGLLRNRNGLRDYRIWLGSAQVRFDAGGRSFTLGADAMHNSEDYSAADAAPFPADDRDQTDGYVLSAMYGRLKDPGDWQADYYYARIETFAVIASYAADDWVRWGSATQTDSSDLKGHEFRFTYGLSAKANLMARLYLADAITTVQDGKRFRVDFNYRF